MNDKGKIQTFPISDSPINDAFEGIVELYYQIKGYITSTGKWFWKYEENKQQRGYQDIDLLAIKNNETILVSVSSNLDDKISFKRNREINNEQFLKLKGFYKRIIEYLQNTNDYKWLIENRKVKKIIAVINLPGAKHLDKISLCFSDEDIEIIGMDKMINEIIDYFNSKEHQNLKIQHQSLRLLQILNNKNLIKKAI